MTFAHLGMRNGKAYSQHLGLGMGIKLSFIKVNFTLSTEKWRIEATLFPNKIPNIFLKIWDWE